MAGQLASRGGQRAGAIRSGSTVSWCSSAAGTMRHLKWWTMSADVTAAGLVDQGTTHRPCGVQNAPVTDSDLVTDYDPVATAYDELHPVTEEAAEEIRSARWPPCGPAHAGGPGRGLRHRPGPRPRAHRVGPLRRRRSQPADGQPARAQAHRGRRAPHDDDPAGSPRGLFTPGQFEVVNVLVSGTDLMGGRRARALARIASGGLVVRWDNGPVVARGAAALTAPRR
jgi:hypothetical protein